MVAVAVPTGVSTGRSMVGSQLFVASYSSNLPISAQAARNMGLGDSLERAMASQCRMRGCGGAYTCKCRSVQSPIVATSQHTNTLDAYKHLLRLPSGGHQLCCAVACSASESAAAGRNAQLMLLQSALGHMAL